VSAPNATGPAAHEGAAAGGTPAADPNALLKPVGPANTTLPAVQAPAKAPDQVNDVKPGEVPQPSATDANSKKKKPKADLSDESSSKKKKKKGLAKIF
jgi:outer membrane protein assembly factor BamD